MLCSRSQGQAGRTTHAACSGEGILKKRNTAGVSPQKYSGGEPTAARRSAVQAQRQLLLTAPGMNPQELHHTTRRVWYELLEQFRCWQEGQRS